MKNGKVFAIAAIAVFAMALSYPAGACGQTQLPGSLTGPSTLTEGQRGTLDGSVTNNTDATIFIGTTSLMTFELHGDPTDSLSVALTNDQCSNASLGAGTTCTFQVSLSTPNGTGETDDDAGYWLVEAVGGGGNPNGSYNFVLATNVTVQNPTPPAATPEPASLLLFGTGLLGLAYFVRRWEKHEATAI